MTKAQTRLLTIIARRRTVVGFFRLTIDEELSYSYTYYCLRALEACGYVRVQRRTGTPSIIQLVRVPRLLQPDLFTLEQPETWLKPGS